VLDWLVEDLLAPPPDELAREMVLARPVGSEDGAIVVAPAAGSYDASFVPKLARAYVEGPRHDGSASTRVAGRSLAERIADMVDQLERVHRADAVLLDLRSGLAETSAVALTRLGATALLFATASSSTWEAYRALVAAWSRNIARARSVRERLKVVSALTPLDGRRQSVVEAVRSGAYDVLSMLYDESSGDLDRDAEAFIWSSEDNDAPHGPVVVSAHEALVGWEPVRGAHQPPLALREAAFGDLCAYVSRLLDEAGDRSRERGT
jgi:hypothetical protein